MRARRGMTVVVALGLVGALGLADGASAAVDAKRKPLPKKAFIKEADKICLQAQTLQNDAANQYFADLGPNQTPDAATLEAFWGESGPVVQQEIDSIRALPAPSADKKRIKKILDAVQRGLDAVTEDVTVLLSGAPFAKADKLAQAYGFKVCGADSGE